MGSNKIQPFRSGNMENLTSVSQRIKSRTGSLEQRAAFSTGMVRTRTITETGGSIDTTIKAPFTRNRAERNAAIRDLYKEGAKQQDIADAFGLTQPSVSNIVRNK